MPPGKHGAPTFQRSLLVAEGGSQPADGKSFIAGADFALAVVKEIEEPGHRRTRFSVAY
jgi:putative NADH-flavin reductase